MAQRIDFAPLPNTAPLAWPATLAPFLAEVDRAAPGLKAVKEWLRLRNLFDKEGFETLMGLLDVRLGEPTTLGPAGKALLEAPDDAAARGVLGQRLVQANPLLAKYALEALDTEKGGRLHSTNELYRLITSYVYPGLKPNLTSFKAWVDWAVAAGLLKLVGIRWALGDAGREALPRLRALDAEEFLDEERAAAAPPDDGDGDGEEPAAAPGPGPAREPAAPAPAAGPPPAPAPVPEPAPRHDPGPVVPDAPTPAAPAAPRAPRPAPAPAPLPLRIPAPEAFEPPSPAPAPLDLAATRDALRAWHDRWPGRRSPPGAAVGAADAFEAAAAALWMARGMAPADAGRALASLRDSGLLAEAGRGTLTLAALASAVAGTPDPAVALALEAAPALPRLHAGTRDPTLLQADGPRDLLDRLWRRLYAPGAPLAPFLLARLLRDAGALPDALTPAALVPTFTVRENAFRIGFLPRLHAASFQDLAEAALALAAWFPEGEAPLALVHEGFGCAFRCGRAPACPLSCLERGEVAPGRTA